MTDDRYKVNKEIEDINFKFIDSCLEKEQPYYIERDDYTRVMEDISTIITKVHIKEID